MELEQGRACIIVTCEGRGHSVLVGARRGVASLIPYVVGSMRCGGGAGWGGALRHGRQQPVDDRCCATGGVVM